MIGVSSTGAPLSASFDEAVSGSFVSYDVALVLDGEPLDCSIASLALRLGNVSGSDDGSDGIQLGGVYSSTMEARLHGCQVPLPGRELEMRVGVDTGSGYEYVTVALLTVTRAATADNGATSVQACGRVSAMMSGIVSGVPEGYADVKEVCASVSEVSGVEVVISDGFPTTEQIIWVGAGWTCRRALQEVALWLGGYAAETNDGRVLVSPLPTLPSKAADPDQMPSYPELSDEDYVIDGLTVTVSAGDEDEAYDEAVDEAAEDVSWVYGTGRLYVEDRHATREMADALWANVDGTSFTPGSMTFAVLDPRLTPFDALAVDRGGNTHVVPCLGISATFDGGWWGSIEATAATESAKQATEQGPLAYAVSESRDAANAASAAASRASDAVELIEGRVAASERAIETIDGNVARVERETEAAIGTIRGDVSVISGYVADAQAAAGRAETAASGAQAAASEAVAGLGRVEDVVGTVTWLGEHSAPTSDTSPVPGKTYYEKRPDGRLVAVDDVPSNPAQAGLYELTDSVQRYLSTHLALTDEGLVVASDGSSNRLLLSSDAMRFQDAYNLDVAYIEVDPATNVSVFYITKSVVLKELKFGMFKFFERANGNMGFKYVGQGV